MSFPDMPETQHTGRISLPCGNDTGCSEEIQPGDTFAVSATGVRYCRTCGNRLRYHRKKAAQRGETLPVTFADVARRHA